jgi:hypothetical protein
LVQPADRPRSWDYLFAVVELQVHSEGNGSGTMALAAQLLDGTGDGTLRAKSWAATPVYLKNVTRAQ